MREMGTKKREMGTKKREMDTKNMAAFESKKHHRICSKCEHFMPEPKIVLRRFILNFMKTMWQQA